MEIEQGPSGSGELQEANEEQIDEALKESFPASDPAFWTLGCTAPPKSPTAESAAEPTEAEPHQGR